MRPTRALWLALYALLAIVLGWVLAAAFFVFTVEVLHEIECNRGECGFWGELVDEHWWLIVFGLAPFSALCLWPLFRGRFRRPMRG